MIYLGRDPVGITSGAAFPIDDTAGGSSSEETSEMVLLASGIRSGSMEINAVTDTGISWQTFSQYKRLVFIYRVPSGTANQGNTLIGFHDSTAGMLKWSFNTGATKVCELYIEKINDDLHKIVVASGDAAIYWSARDSINDTTKTPYYPAAPNIMARQPMFLKFSEYKEEGTLKLYTQSIPQADIAWYLWGLTR